MTMLFGNGSWLRVVWQYRVVKRKITQNTDKNTSMKENDPHPMGSLCWEDHDVLHHVIFPTMSLALPSTVSHALMWDISGSSSRLCQSYHVCAGLVLPAKGKWLERGAVTSPRLSLPPPWRPAPSTLGGSTPHCHSLAEEKPRKELEAVEITHKGKAGSMVLTGPHRCVSENVTPPPTSALIRLRRMPCSESWNFMTGSVL